MPQFTADVAVVGAGPAGLAAAIAVRRALPRTRVHVFDKTSSFRPAGSFIGLSLNGRSALDALCPAALALLEKHTIHVNEQRLLDKQDQLVRSTPAMTNPLFWWQVQRCLLEQLPADIVHAQHGLRLIDQLPGDAGYEVTFENGDTYRCSYLIGADGARSTVRRNILDDAPAEYNGSTSCRGYLPMPDWWPYPQDIISYEGQLLALPMGDGLLGWGTMEVMPEPSRERCRDAAGVKARLIKAFESFPQLARRLIQETPEADIMQHANYAREGMGDMPRWGGGAATLVGDAAHVVSNTMGQGTSMALEDALELGRALVEHGLSQQAFRAYEDVRRSRVRTLADITNTYVQLQRQGFAAVRSAEAQMVEVRKVVEGFVRTKHEPFMARQAPEAVAANGSI